jgi:hypothetical protein
LRIHKGGKTTSYFARWEVYPLGVAVELSKLDGGRSVYVVALPHDGPGLCDHPQEYGQQATHDCKHLQALRAMIAAGQLGGSRPAAR